MVKVWYRFVFKTTEKLNKIASVLNGNVCFSPEFLTEANSIEDFKLGTDKWSLVMGSEAHGLSQSVSDLINHKILNNG